MEMLAVFSRDDFREWLRMNHDKQEKVSLVIHKKHTGKPSPSHRELMEEAICFGWIDTTVKRIDEDTYMRNFSRRNSNSRWSNNTLRYARELIKQGKMAPAGMKYYKEGLKRPVHDAGIPKDPDMPKALKEALVKDKDAEMNFNKFPPSSKRMIYRWILRAKRDDTISKRISITVSKAKAGDKDIFSA